MPRTYTRSFDWDEARRRNEAGETKASLAREYGVTTMAIYMACRPEQYEKSKVRRAEWSRAGKCPDCGTQTTRQHVSENARCVRCSAIARSTSARDGELQCVTCREWFPDENFPSNRKERHARRGRHAQCRSCQTIARREYRHRNREASNAYDREYKRRRKLEAMSK